MSPDEAARDAPLPALRITSLTLRGFRNLASLAFTPGPRFNVLFGDNGAGKSSVLEAIGYLASLRSFRGRTTVSSRWCSFIPATPS